jgi:hypothetical protein
MYTSRFDSGTSQILNSDANHDVVFAKIMFYINKVKVKPSL